MYFKIYQKEIGFICSIYPTIYGNFGLTKGKILQIHLIPDRDICILCQFHFKTKRHPPSPGKLLFPSRYPSKCETGSRFDEPTGEIRPGLSSNLTFVLKLSLASHETSRENSFKTINCCFRFLDESCMRAEEIGSIQKKTSERSISDSSRPFSSLCFLHRRDSLGVQRLAGSPYPLFFWRGGC